MRNYTAIQLMAKLLERIAERIDTLEAQAGPEAAVAIAELRTVQENLRKARLYLMQKP